MSDLKTIELKIHALGKAVSDAVKELEKIKEKPAPAAKRNLKSKRVQTISDYYTNLQLKKIQRNEKTNVSVQL